MGLLRWVFIFSFVCVQSRITFSNPKNYDFPTSASLSNNWIRIADVQFEKGDFTNALSNYFRALYLADSFQDNLVKATLFHHIATCYSNLGDYSSSLYFGKKALQLLHQPALKNPRLESETHNLLGSILVGPENYVAAKFHFEKALKLQNAIQDKREIGNIYQNYGCLQMENGDFELAEKSFLKALTHYESVGDSKGIATSYINLAILLVNQSEVSNVDWNKGIQLANAATTANKKVRASDCDLRIFELKALFFKELDYVDSSLFYTNSFHLLKDSLFDIDRMREMNNLKSKYEIQNKELKINRLSLEKKNAEQQTVFWQVALLLLLVTVVFIVLLFRNQKMKQALFIQRKEREQELRFLQSQMNPHFLFNTLTSAQSMVVQGNKIEAADFLGKFSKLLRLGLDLNHQEKIVLSDEIQFLKTLIEMEMMRNSLSINFTLKGNFLDFEDEAYVPPMLLQPFVENALLHGLPYVENPFLMIEMNGTENKLFVTITNNFNPKRSTSLKRKSRGIEITKKRVELLNSHDQPDLFKVEIVINDEIFTVQLVLPLQFTP